MTVSTIHLHSPIKLLVLEPAPEIAGTEPLAEAGRMMGVRNVSAVLVDRGEAILTERDVTRAMSAGRPSDAPVSEVATPSPLTVSCDLSILDATALMLNEEVRHLVVELDDGGRGVISLRVLVAVLLQAAQPEPWLLGLRRLTQSEIWLG